MYNMACNVACNRIIMGYVRWCVLNYIMKDNIRHIIMCIMRNVIRYTMMHVIDMSHRAYNNAYDRPYNMVKDHVYPMPAANNRHRASWLCVLRGCGLCSVCVALCRCLSKKRPKDV